MNGFVDLEREVARQMRHLANSEWMPNVNVLDRGASNKPVSVQPRFTSEQMADLLRIEASLEFFAQLRGSRDYFDFGRGYTPVKFMGVTVYRCGPEFDLPPCGWRVVNPLLKGIGL
jgi:hypothetical protein